ncbi:flavodoxin family protein [Microseira sp. BLCC-F43]|jgi:multimeric flavodoxin WrbA|uniref:flavodoxin family protein n=1 Tax=Microseira sp. BLCC-F43 TaxID=3153602 RepID=UPI0035BAB810
MTTVAIVYHTGTGHTGALAEAIAKGAASVENVTVHLLQITPQQIGEDGRWADSEIMAKLDAYDAIIFGCPTWMGSVSSVFKAFMEGTFSLWFDQRWKDKIAGGFTNSASQSGDKLSTLFQLSIFANQLSMIWVGLGDPPGNNQSTRSVNDINRLGTWLGMMSQSDGDRDATQAPPMSDRITGERYGRIPS